MGKVDGKVVIVTGASRGIGAAIAKRFAEEGAEVVCAGRSLTGGSNFNGPMEGSLQQTVNEIQASGGKATAFAVNIAEYSECERLVKFARSTYGPVDVLVNNATLIETIPTKDYPIDRWLTAWAVSFHACFFLSKLVLEDMIPRRSGSIVSISSGAATGPGRGPYTSAPAQRLSGTTCYGATKAALERFTQGLAQEVYPYGISVSAVSPSQTVPTPSAVSFNLLTGPDDPRGESPNMLADASLLLATEPLDKVTGRVTYSQLILKEFGWIQEAKGTGIDPTRRMSGYAMI